MLVRTVTAAALTALAVAVSPLGQAAERPAAEPVCAATSSQGFELQVCAQRDGETLRAWGQADAAQAGACEVRLELWAVPPTGQRPELLRQQRAACGSPVHTEPASARPVTAGTRYQAWLFVQAPGVSPQPSTATRYLD